MRLLLEHAADHRVVGEAADAPTLLAGLVIVLPRLVIVDWALPGLPRHDPLRPLVDGQPELRVVVISVRPGDGDASRQAGADGFVCKLEPPERLLGVVAGLMGGG
jgi:DNA-binding NarL/FixJ family response regulator